MNESQQIWRKFSAVLSNSETVVLTTNNLKTTKYKGNLIVDAAVDRNLKNKSLFENTFIFVLKNEQWDLGILQRKVFSWRFFFFPAFIGYANAKAYFLFVLLGFVSGQEYNILKYVVEDGNKKCSRKAIIFD